MATTDQIKQRIEKAQAKLHTARNMVDLIDTPDPDHSDWEDPFTPEERKALYKIAGPMIGRKMREASKILASIASEGEGDA